MKKIIICLWMLAMYATSHAQIIERFDLNPGPKAHTPITSLTVYKNKLYFLACDSAHGLEYRYTTGGDTPTFSLLQDINPSKRFEYFNPVNAYITSMAVVNGYLLFSAQPDSNGSRQLWVYDDINPAKAADAAQPGIDRDPQFFAVLNNKVYYQAKSITNEINLFEYDPLTDTKQSLITMFPDTNRWSCNIAAFNGKLYMAVHDAITGAELHEYTPGQPSSVLVHDVYTGPTDSRLVNLYPYNGRLYFLATRDTRHINELWSYDGTNPPVNHTAQAGGFGIGIASEHKMHSLAGFQNAIYFAGNDVATGHELFKYDIATNTISMVYEFGPGPTAVGDPRYLTVCQNKLYMYATDTAESVELWTYDGINPPKMTVLCPGSGVSFPMRFTEFGNDIYFTAADSVVGGELFRIHDTTTPPDTPTHITTFSLKGKVTTYPNPTQSNTTLEVSLHDAQTFAITLTDVYGRTVHTIAKKQYNAGKHNITIPMQSLPPGIYYYHIANGKEQLATGKVMKE